MGMETLNNAAHAAGFAMAASDDPYEAVRTETKPSDWRAGEPVLRHVEPADQRASRKGEWARSLFGLFGRRAPA